MDYVQLRWVRKNPLTSYLQCRIRDPEVDASGAICAFGSWSLWINVPFVVLSDVDADSVDQRSMEEIRK